MVDFKFKIYDSSTDFIMKTPTHEIPIDKTKRNNAFIVENERYIAIISEHEVIMFRKPLVSDKYQVKRFNDPSVKITTLSHEFAERTSENRVIDGSIFDEYKGLKGHPLEPVISKIMERSE